jgi:hypothetical protein
MSTALTTGLEAGGQPIIFRHGPRSIPETLRAFRQDVRPVDQPCNIVVDPRIFHGSTFARRSALGEQITPIPLYPKKVAPRSADQEFDDLHRDGFTEALVQTEDFDGTVIIIKKEESVGIQTDQYVEKPIVHRKPPAAHSRGVRTALPGTDLFDFNVQVVPVVKTLIQKALTQASMEVAEELEIEQMNTYLRAFEQKAKRDAEAIARLERLEADKFEKKRGIVENRKEIAQAEAEVRSKVLACGFAEWLVWDIQEDVIRILDGRQYFYDELEREIEEKFLPWLTEQATIEIAKASVPDALSEATFDRGNEIIDEMCGEMQVREQIVGDQSDVKDLINKRRLIAEDRVARAWRTSKQIKRNQKKKAAGSDEEGEGDEGQDAAGSGYESEA